MKLTRLLLFMRIAVGSANRAVAAEPVPPHQSFTLESKALQETRRINVYTKAQSKLRNTLYLSSADEENIVPAVTRLADTLRVSSPAGLKWQYEPRPDLRHDNIYRSVSPQVLRKWFAPEATHRAP